MYINQACPSIGRSYTSVTRTESKQSITNQNNQEKMLFPNLEQLIVRNYI